FTPGLVGGHCIGVDPYYLTYAAEKTGYHSQIVLSGRQINDDMGRYVVQNLVKKLIQANVNIKGSKVAIFGLTFKENTPDTRNTRVIDVITLRCSPHLQSLESVFFKLFMGDPA